MSDSSSILATIDVSVRFGRSTVLDGVSVSVASGELVALIGPNGSGKTTLLRAILGLADLSSGSVTRPGDVAYLPQTPTHLPGQIVSDVLLSGRPSQRSPFGIETRRDHEIVAALAHELELETLLHRPMEKLSGGQRQRAFVGRALAAEPNVLLLDEPATFLDLRHQVELYQLLRKLSAERKLAVLMASHDLNLAAAHCDRIVVLSQGKVAADGPPREVLRAQLLSDVYHVPLSRVEIDGQVHIVPDLR
ncbi:MAG: ABC transporter ATP-binding protein [Tepidisphaeraceae bacterium]